MLSLVKETKGGAALLVVTEKSSDVIELIANANKHYKKVCYISCSKPYSYFIDFIKKNNINSKKFFFIDCITKRIVKKTKKYDNCIYASNPNSFENIAKTIRKTLTKKKFDFIIFDSVSYLFGYEAELIITRFLHNLIAMIKGLGYRSAFIVLKRDVEKNTIKDIGMITDKIINLK